MNLIYAGTPEFAQIALAAILASKHQVVAVLTQPDKPAGRGRKLTASPVKRLALDNGIEVAQPHSLREPKQVDYLRSLRADCMVVAAYGLILPQEVLDVPPRGCLNIHASLLPRWRGAAPIQRAIEAGDEHSGVCIMQMDAGLDTGAIVASQQCAISADETGQTLHDKLAKLGAKLIVQTLDDMQHGPIKASAQASDGVTYAKKLSKAQGEVDWQQSAASIERKIRAFNPWPVAYCTLPDSCTAKGKRLRLLAARDMPGGNSGPDSPPGTPGTIVHCDRRELQIQCGIGQLQILSVQPEGRKPMPIDAFLNSIDLRAGMQLG